MNDVARQAAEQGPSRIAVTIEFPDGAYRRFMAEQPCDYALAIAESGNPGEPRITVSFAGNPAAGGLRVFQEGAARW